MAKRIIALFLFPFVWETGLVSGLRMGDNSVKASFPASSNSLNFPRMMMISTLPKIDEFTLCFWVKIKGQVDREHSIFSYTLNTEINSNKLLVSVDHSHTSPRIIAKIGSSNPVSSSCPSFSAGNWHKICIAWRSVDGKLKFSVDQDLCDYEVENIAKGYTIQSGGIIVLGQERGADGAFQLNKNLIGDITQVKLWDEYLNNEQTGRASSCLSQACKNPYCYLEDEIQGNLIQWLQTPFVLLDGIELSGTAVCK
ncbi:C-reactive protein 1.4-like [Limulus polyphemus]|uniref:C-reactive protein 1.4-like n=1 Tax=Limulus polyphemus TaxID=6850 RepID=A0ABM1AZL3_LIMPO|nr:C-reactive protein 1.4-like [Limulus polyphemus]